MSDIKMAFMKPLCFTNYWIVNPGIMNSVSLGAFCSEFLCHFEMPGSFCSLSCLVMSSNSLTVHELNIFVFSVQ